MWLVKILYCQFPLTVISITFFTLKVLTWLGVYFNFRIQYFLNFFPIIKVSTCFDHKSIKIINYTPKISFLNITDQNNKIPTRTNIIFVIDVHGTKASTHARALLSDVLDTIPFQEYRVGIFSTNGLSQKILDFQTRQCSGRIFM